MVSHIFSTALNGSVNWPWSMERVAKVTRWEFKDLETDPQTKNESLGRVGELQKENIEGDEGQKDEDEIADDGRRMPKTFGRPWIGPTTTETYQLRKRYGQF